MANKSVLKEAKSSTDVVLTVIQDLSLNGLHRVGDRIHVAKGALFPRELLPFVEVTDWGWLANPPGNTKEKKQQYQIKAFTRAPIDYKSNRRTGEKQSRSLPEDVANIEHVRSLELELRDQKEVIAELHKQIKTLSGNKTAEKKDSDDST